MTFDRLKDDKLMSWMLREYKLHVTLHSAAHLARFPGVDAFPDDAQLLFVLLA